MRRRGRRLVDQARRTAGWYSRALAAGPRELLSGNDQVSTVVWLALLGAPAFALLALVLAVVQVSATWLMASAFGAAVSAVLLVLVVKVWRYESKTYGGGARALSPTRTGAKAMTAEGRVSSAVGEPTVPLVHDAHGRVPSATVVVACYNDAHLLGAALHSLQLQSIADWECVVVDDASTDESFDVALVFAERDNRFRVVRHDRNRGLSAARNTGLGLAQADYVMFLDSDDFLYRASLEERLAHVTAGPGCIGAYCDWRGVPESTGYVPEAAVAPAQRPSVHLMTLGFDVPFIASAPLVRTDVMRAAGGFDETLPTAEDADMWSRLLRGGVWFAYAPYVGVAYRQRSGSMVRRSPLGHLDVVQGVMDRLAKPWETPWPGAPAPLAAPVGDYLEDMALLPRKLNFLALHVALMGPGGVEERHLPGAELRAVPGYRALLEEQAGRALNRLGESSQRRRDELTAELLRVAPPVDLSLPALPASEPPPLRGRLMYPGVRSLGAGGLHKGPPVFLLVPQSRYHVTEVGPLLESLRARGVRAEVYLPPEAGEAVGRELATYVDTVYDGPPDELVGAPLLGAFLLNDWGGNMQVVLEAVRKAGGVSFAKVEGVADWDDVDTGRIRRSYQHADVTLAQGRNDVDALPGQDVRVVGSSRLERIWLGEPAAADNDRVLVNVNFTYGVLNHKQDEWIWAAVRGARALGIDYELSLHPAQNNLPKSPDVLAHVSTDPFSHALRRSGVLVSRFSTVIFEAMALGVPAVYLNSHGEKVPTFQDPQGAFVKVTGTDLRAGLAEALSWRGEYRARAEEFFRRQVDVVPGYSSEERSADVIVDMIKA
jgi:GT2 family glycosyltransferase